MSGADPTTILQAELTWTGSRFERDVAVHLQQGRIKAIAKPQASDRNVVNLDRRALIPGFVNAHSHAFQRGLRREAQRFDAGSGNFWTWRETMYRLAETLDVESFYETSKRCFEEMLLAGMTSVGEFHYLHHAGADAKDWAFDDAIINAARDAGIRLVLIQTYYATGNIGRPLEAGAQTRFGPVSRDEFMKQLDRIGGKLDPAMQSLAVACHSIRASSIDDFVYFRDYSIANGLPFHVHVEEARKEIADCVAAYGVNPMRVLLDKLKIDDNFTSIHVTHSDPDDLREYLSRGGRVCLCPVTEGNLSDGFPDVPRIRSSNGNICIGTDSNIRLSMNEEMRWLEFGQRLRREQRGIVISREGLSARALFEIGTRNGADALRLDCGAIEAGRIADLVSIDLNHASVRGANDDAILDSLIFGSGNGPIDEVWVNGQPVARASRPC